MPNKTSSFINSTECTQRNSLVQTCDDILQPHLFVDYGPNGLQVEGKTDIRVLVSGVTASLALIQTAVDLKADAILVHHGLFWRGQNGTLTGWMKQRLSLLLVHNINLLAYHLPLDAHVQFGNNVQLGLIMGWILPKKSEFQSPLNNSSHENVLHFGDKNLGWLAFLPQPILPNSLQHQLQQSLGRPVISVISSNQKPIQKLAWCTGGAQSYFEAAIAAGADAFVTGEISEPQAHIAKECGVHYFSAGHHATERYGVAALGQHLGLQLGLRHHFVDIDNPA